MALYDKTHSCIFIMKLKKIFFLIFIFILIYPIALGALYRFVPPVSTLMVARFVTLKNIKHENVTIKKVSPKLIRAVIRAEDSKFCQHSGIDWKSMVDAINDKDDGSRGASTIPMQVAKNLFLWPSHSYIRKIIEIPIALYLDAIWPKSRMMEIYLSIAQWGNGIYGVEAAAQKYFHKSAKYLNARESALLAAMLPNPIKRNPLKPSRYYSRYANSIQKWSNSDVDMSCIKKN